MTSIDEIVRELRGLLEKIPEGPYFAAEDEARDAPPHTNSGLAMVDAGRVSEWPAARLIEWPMARAVAALLTRGPALLSALARREEALRKCGADYISPPCTVPQGVMYLSEEFARRAEIANAALEDNTK